MAPHPIHVRVVPADDKSNILPGPVWPWYSGQEVRRASFSSGNTKWPTRLDDQPLVQRLSRQGFFSLQRVHQHEERGDLAICFYCGQGHMGWDANDEPLFYHEANFGATCTRVRLLKRRPTPLPPHDLQHAGEDLRGLVSSFSCKICLTYKVDTVLLPCAHAVSCSNCTARLGKCPLCRKVPTSIVLTFD